MGKGAVVFIVCFDNLFLISVFDKMSKSLFAR